MWALASNDLKPNLRLDVNRKLVPYPHCSFQNLSAFVQLQDLPECFLVRKHVPQYFGVLWPVEMVIRK